MFDDLLFAPLHVCRLCLQSKLSKPNRLHDPAPLRLSPLIQPSALINRKQWPRGFMVPPPDSIEFAMFARKAAFVFLPGLPAGPMGADACCMVMQSILNVDLFETILAVSPPLTSY